MHLRTLIVGACAITIGIMLVLLPLLLSHTNLNKYIVVVGIILCCWGISCLLLGATDWLLTRRR